MSTSNETSHHQYFEQEKCVVEPEQVDLEVAQSIGFGDQEPTITRDEEEQKEVYGLSTEYGEASSESFETLRLPKRPPSLKNELCILVVVVLVIVIVGEL
jgi:hypothetical protein